MFSSNPLNPNRSLSIASSENDINHVPRPIGTESDLIERSRKLETLANRKHLHKQQPSSTPSTSLQLFVAPLVDTRKLDRTYQPLERLRPLKSDEKSKTTTEDHYDYHEKIIANVIAMTLDRLHEENNAAIKNNLDDDWKMAKQNIMQDMMTNQNEKNELADSTTKMIELQPSFNLLDPVPTQEFPGEETPKMIAYYKAFADCQELKDPLVILDKYKNAAASVHSTLEMLEIWSLFKVVANPIKERRLLPKNLRAARMVRIRQFLEFQYREKKYQTTDNRVVKEKISQECGSDQPHKSIFLLCRCGAYDFGTELVRTIFKYEDPLTKFISAIQNYTYTPSLPDEGSVSMTDDSIFYSVLGQLNDFESNAWEKLSNLKNFSFSIEDFLWIKLCGVCCGRSPEESEEETEKEAEEKAIKLTDSIKNENPDHFNAGSNPFFYALLLAICGDFESSIDFLATFSVTGKVNNNSNWEISSTILDPLPDAVHMAIALRKLNLLVSSTNSTSQQQSQPLTSGKPQFSFYDPIRKGLKYGKLLEYYGSRFSDTIKAISYVSYFSEPAPEEIELIPAKKILARPAPNGGPLPLLKKLKTNIGSEKAFKVASQACQLSAPIDAVNVFYEVLNNNLFDDQKRDEFINNGVQLVNRQLAKIMDYDSQNVERKFWKEEGKRFYNLLKKIGKEKNSNGVVLLKLQDCILFYDQFFNGDEDAPLTLGNWLFPMNSGSIDNYVDDFSRLDSIFDGIFPSLVSTIIKCHEMAFQKGKTSEAKNRLRLLVGFIASLRENADYRLHPEVERELAKAESRICV